MPARVSVRFLIFAMMLLLPWPAVAEDTGAAAPDPSFLDAERPADSLGYMTGPAWRVDFGVGVTVTDATPARIALTLPATFPVAAQDPSPGRPRPVAFEYSDAYRTRRRIHVYSSVALLPLFVTQFALGDSLYDNATDGKHTAHVAVGSGIGVLFGVNTVTGVWNLWEGRKDPTRRARRLAHGIMMLGADAGFFATAMLAPGDGGGNRSTHRAVALTSMGIATAGYLFMLLTK